eukprot:g8496.t1
MSLFLRSMRCDFCVARARREWEELQSVAAPDKALVHPYLASFLRVTKCPPHSHLEQGRVAVYIDAPVGNEQGLQENLGPPAAGADEEVRGPARQGHRHEVLRCTKCGHTGQIAKMLPHLVVCHAVAKGRIPVSLVPHLCKQAGADKGTQSWSGASGQAPAKGTSEKWDLALLQLSIGGNPPPPNSCWSKDLPLSVLLLNLDGALLNRWPWLVAEINASSQLPLLVVLSEADITDSLWEKVLRLLQITLHHRYAVIRAKRAIALLAHSLQLPTMKPPALVPGADDVMAIQIAHKDLAGEALVGYVSPNKNRPGALKALNDYVAGNAASLCLVAGDWNLGAETQPDVLWVRKQPGQSSVTMATVTEPSRLPVGIKSHRRIDWRGKAAPAPGSSGPVEVGGEPEVVPPGFRRRAKFEITKASDQSLSKAAELCRAALADGTFNSGAMEAALAKANVPRSKARRPPLPMPLIQDSGRLTTTSQDAAEVLRARVMEGRPASLRRTPAEQKEHDEEVEKLIEAAPDDPFEATWDVAYRARKRLNKDAAPGTDGVSAKFLFVCDTLLLLLVQCFCAAFNAFRDPPWSKTYLVNFLFKAKKRAASICLPRFYRPVTLINIVDKLAEAIMLEKMGSALAVVADNFAYHAGWSPAAGLLRSLLYTLSSAAPYIGVIVGDVQGGFENAYLLHVLRVLAAKGAGKQLLRAVVFWFAGRTIIILVDGLLSAATAISEGLGQGALLSPALFRIVIEEGMTRVGFRTNQTLAEVVTGFSDELAIFVTAWSEAELLQKLQARGSQLLDMPYPVADFRIAVIRCPEDQDATDSRKRALARRLKVHLKSGVLLTLPETWALPEDDGLMVSATTGVRAWHPETCISVLGVPLTANSAAWATWLEDQRRAVDVTATQVSSCLLDPDNKNVETPLDLVDQYHQKIFSTLHYMTSVKSRCQTTSVILLTCADVCHRVGLSNKKVNSPEIARRIKREFEDLESSLGPGLLWVATDSGDDPTDFDPCMRVGTIVMRFGNDRDADCVFALRLAHLFTTFIGEAGAVISALTILDDSADVPDAPLNTPQLRYVIFQIDAAGVVDDLKSNIREQMWVRAREILARLGKRYEGKIVFVLHWHSQFSQLADDVALPPASQQPVPSQEEEQVDIVDDGGDVAMDLADADAAGPHPEDGLGAGPVSESDEEQDAGGNEAKTNILWCHMARHFVEGDCIKVVEWFNGADEEPVTPRSSLKSPTRMLRALLALAGHPAPVVWPVKKSSAPKRDEDPLRKAELDNVSDAADRAAQVIEGHWLPLPVNVKGSLRGAEGPAKMQRKAASSCRCSLPVGPHAVAEE